jgi:hypothetical protein
MDGRVAAEKVLDHALYASVRRPVLEADAAARRLHVGGVLRARRHIHKVVATGITPVMDVGGSAQEARSAPIPCERRARTSGRHGGLRRALSMMRRLDRQAGGRRR